MKKQIITLLYLCFSYYCFSQKEIYFVDPAKETIQVESMQGLYVTASTSTIEFRHLRQFGRDRGVYYLGYFHEGRIARSLTLDKTFRLRNLFFSDYRTIINEEGYWTNTDEKELVYNLSAEASVEPRWYFTYKNRYIRGMAKLNSGWFLSLPVTAELPVLSSPRPYPGYEKWSFPENINLNLHANVGLGYRQSLSDNFFMEGRLLLGDLSYYMSSYGNSFYFQMVFQLQLKAAYRF